MRSPRKLCHADGVFDSGRPVNGKRHFEVIMSPSIRFWIASAGFFCVLAAWSAEPPPVTVTGEIIDSACYIKSGARGESHRSCAQKCGDAGIPLALVED